MNMARKLKTIKTMYQRKNRAFDIFYDTVWSITKWVPSQIKRHKIPCQSWVNFRELKLVAWLIM